MPPAFAPSEMPCWQQIFTSRQPASLDWPITRLCLPGTHDSATYGPGSCPTNVARFNWHCQSLDIYDQACAGVRYFDLRLERENNSVADSRFWPYHGAAKRTGDRLADGPEGIKTQPDARWRDTIAGQLLHFVEENSSELIVIHVTGKDESKFVDTIWETLLNTLGPRCVPATDSAGHVIPTVSEVRQRGQNFVVIVGDEDTEPEDGSPMLKPPQKANVIQFVQEFIWKVPGKSVLQSPYESAVWKSNDPTKVRDAIDKWVTEHADVVSERSHFWVAQCQLTPSINNAFGLVQSLWNKKMTTSPANLAEIMNPYVQSVLIQEAEWRKVVSMVQVDFAEPILISQIASINLDALRAR